MEDKESGKPQNSAHKNPLTTSSQVKNTIREVGVS